MLLGSYEDMDLPVNGVSIFYHYNDVEFYRPRAKGFDGVHHVPKYFQINLAFGKKVWYIMFGKIGGVDYGITQDNLRSDSFKRISPGRYIRNAN